MSSPFGRSRLVGAEWDHLFLLLLTRSGMRCEAQSEACTAGRNGDLRGVPRDRVAAHHRLPRGQGGTTRADAHSLAALMLVCEGCHTHLETAERGEAYLRGWLVPYQVPGKPTAATDPAQVVLVLPGGRRVLLHPTSPEYMPPADGLPYAA